MCVNISTRTAIFVAPVVTDHFLNPDVPGKCMHKLERAMQQLLKYCPKLCNRALSEGNIEHTVLRERSV